MYIYTIYFSHIINIDKQIYIQNFLTYTSVYNILHKVLSIVLQTSHLVMAVLNWSQASHPHCQQVLPSADR